MGLKLGFMGASLLVLATAFATGASAQTQAAPATVRVSGFQVTGNTLLNAAAVDAVLMPLLGVRTIDELQRAAAAVQALYAAEGYGAVVAYLPPQSGQGGIVTIAVVEGKVAQVQIKGNQRFSNDNIRASLPALKEGQTPRVRDLDAQLRIANENPAKQAQVLLKPGQRSGDADAEITVAEQPLSRFGVGVDNTGNERTGEYRVSAGWQHANLSGHDDVLSTQLQTSPTDPGQVRVLSAGYRWPLYRARVALDFFAAYSDIDGGTAQALPGGDLTFNGRGRIFGARAGWYLPRRGDFDQRLALALDRRDYLNQCSFGGNPCGPAGASVSVSPISIEYLAQTASPWPISLGLTLQRNLSLGGAHSDAASFAAARLDAKPGYSALRWNASAAYPLDLISEDWQLRGRITGQFTADALVSGEQFGLGGAASVRGYEERELVGDRGVFASIEVGGPNLLGDSPGGATALRLHGFVDAGSVSNNGAAFCADGRSHCTLASLGAGLRYVAGTLQARLDLAYPMKSAVRTQRGDTRAHFAIHYGF